MPCKRCSAPAFDPSTVKTNRGGLCEACFVGDLEAELAADEEEELKRLTERDRQMNRKGKKYRVTAWIHPVDGGDDYQVDWYFETRPTRKQIRSLVHAKRSSVADDFQVVAI